MQRRAFLLFTLFVVLAVFYASVTRERLPTISTEQESQTRQLERLDEEVLGHPAAQPEED